MEYKEEKVSSGQRWNIKEREGVRREGLVWIKMEYKGEGVRREGLVWIKMEYKEEGVRREGLSG